ncbi:PAS domain S-box protein [methanotrophic endosymbiont of Bathymodiolus puteoserpentis (Logatchev)]|jgi:diguanylate cyclase (GGDEF)-like protein/PAS domain S-box-containing protein|uniref:PAS domain S-box protein n=1 Tax=methanotrophic endosymbiont of Bathymodiolus puteoserpentis (Logatchev) TaxID=343235 RepID=UPI0013CDBE51|nr:PAS domain S-box protein [methanotrophic endosymbiont of Bathymodiolus puteoserpentis (Logatchev)]SHE22716.1 diguanylate cyclase/phosphodiesterase (GGDEF & EAL domains) with PAS/PAC sensor(s) [methanotrophic endosymbiont of Bathymodiolus puteoserpentis (Logatchev)]
MAINSLLNKVTSYSVNMQFLLLESGTQVLYIDSGMRDLLGYDEKDFIESGLNFFDLIHPDDQDIAKKLLALKSQTSLKIVNFRCRKANGKILCLQGCYQKSYETSVGLKLTLQMTDAKALNQYLDTPILLSNFTTMMESSDDYIYFKDRNHVFTGASQTLVALTNPSDHWHDLIGKTDYDVFPEEYADAYYRLEKQVFLGAPVASERQKILDNQGNIGWIDNRKYPIVDNNNEIIGLFGIARDITETVINQQKVEQLLAEKQAILETSLVGFATLQNRKIIWGNSALAKLLGYSKNELIGMPARVLYAHEEDYKKIGVAYAELNEQDISQNEIECLRKDGSQLWVSFSGTLLDKEQGISLWSLIDVTSNKLSEQALRESEIRFRTLFESSSDAVILLGDSGFINCNQATLKIFGCSTVVDFCTRAPAELSSPLQPCGADSSELAAKHFVQAKQQGSYRVEWQCKRLDSGEEFPAEVLLTSMILDNEQVLQIVVRDITQRKQVEIERNEALNRIQNISKSVPGMIFQFRLNADGSSCFPYVTSVIFTFFQVSPEEVEKSSDKVFAAIHPDDLPQVLVSINTSKETLTPWYKEFRVRSPERGVQWLLVNALPEKGEQGAVIWNGLVTDITERKKMEAQIHQLAFYDELTSLANRRLLKDRLNLAMSSSKRTQQYGAVMILDLDNFKPLNDAHGHLVGDLLLIEAANRMTRCVREIDTVARFGGDEFVVMLNGLDTDKAVSTLQAKTIAEKICSLLAEPYFLTVNQGKGADIIIKYCCSASIGVAMFMNHDFSNEEILNWADAAMYQAKEAGRNQIQFYQSTSE